MLEQLPTPTQRVHDQAWTALFAACRELAARECWDPQRAQGDEWEASRLAVAAGVAPHELTEAHVGSYLEGCHGSTRSVAFAALRRLLGAAVTLGLLEAHQLPVTLGAGEVGSGTAAAYRAESWRYLLEQLERTSDAAAATVTSQLNQAQWLQRWVGDVAVSAVDTALLERYLDTLHAPATRRMARARLRTLFALATRLGLVATSPAEALYRPRQAAATSANAPQAWQQLLAAFEEDATGQDSTISSHVRRSKTFARWADVAPDDVDEHLLARYLSRTSWSKATADAARVSLRAVFAYAAQAGYTRRNPTRAYLVPPTAAATPATGIGVAGSSVDPRSRMRVAAQTAHPARAWARATGRPVSRTGALSGDLIAEWQAAGSPVVCDDAGEHMHAWAELVADYELAQRARGMADSSIAQWKRLLFAFARWCGIAPVEVTEDLLVTYLAHDGWSPQTRRSHRSALAGLFRHALRTGWVDTDPAADLDTVRVPAGVPRPAPEHVIRTAVATDDLRLRLMLALGAQDGLRRAEIAVAAVEDFTAEGLRIHGKGSKIRLVPIHAELRSVLEQYLATTGIRAGWLFPSPAGGHLTPHHVGKLVSRALNGPWTAHTLRHRFNTRAHAATRDLRAVQELAGHASVATTAGYVAVVGADLERAVAAVPDLLDNDAQVAPDTDDTAPADEQRSDGAAWG